MSKKRFLVIVGIVAAAVLLSVLFYTMLANHRPAVTSLEAEPRLVLPRGSCQIAYNASDPDGDELSYNWSANGGEITEGGATVTWTAPYFQGSYNITVTVTDGRGGEDTDYVIITVRANNSPTITSLIADADWTLPSGSLQVTCDASDRDGDELNYEWTATGGDISGTGTVVNWTAPQELGTCNVTVVVTDGYGGEDTWSVILSVATGTPPTIADLIVTAKEPKYLKTTTTGYKVWKTKEYDIECIVSDTSGGVIYVWSCTGGEISGEGSRITWTAPNQSSVDATVTVIVSDVTGNKVGRSINFNVPSCACGF
jgi:predicted secreted protein